MKQAALTLYKRTSKNVDLSSEESAQLSLFELLDKEDENYSHIFDLYDAAPKVVWRITKDLIKENGEHKTLVRKFKFQGEVYSLVVSPAHINTKKTDANGDPIIKVVLPKRREELIEEAIRKIAADGQSEMVDGYFSVYFSLRQVQRVLAGMGRTLNLREIRESIVILSKSIVEIQTADGEVEVNAPFFTSELVNRKKWLLEREDAVCAVSFNRLIDKAVRTGEYRRYNFIKAAQYNSLASWLYKRLCRNFKQADAYQRYTLWLSTMTQDSPMPESQRIAKKLQDVRDALNELKEGGDIESWDEVETAYDNKRKNKILDVKFSLIASPGLIRDIITANKRQSKIKEGLNKKLSSQKFKTIIQQFER